jgi:predicted O-linked N-acetylglucosamine transferase (SPINDLY family)
VGFLSHDFRTHPVTQLIADTVDKLDRSRCEVFLYAHGPEDHSAWRQRLQAGADHFVDFGEATDSAIAHRIRNDGIDVLVDLGGHTRGTRLPVLAWRPAPVQACFLGYPGTTGAAGVDYLVGDAIVTPLDHAADASEKLAQLSGCVLPASRHRPLPAPMTRAEAGLPADALVLCAFNNGYKILPATFDIWCEALRANPQAVLWLKAPNEALKLNLRREGAARGVAPERLVFAEDKIAFDEHFSRLALADLFVDNWPYNAHTTASDALWAGLPVLTLCGRTFASRVAASLMHGAGLDEFVCRDVDAYRERLIALARNPQQLSATREALKRDRLRLPIFDSDAYAANLLALFERMHGRWMAGQSPEHLLAN